MEQTTERELALALARLVLARRGLDVDEETAAELADYTQEAAELRADDLDDSLNND